MVYNPDDAMMPGAMPDGTMGVPPEAIPTGMMPPGAMPAPPYMGEGMDDRNVSTEPNQNLAEMLEKHELLKIGREVIEMYEADKASMQDWFDGNDQAEDLLGAERQAKMSPFPNASNIKYPAIITAAMQFNARAYSAIVPSTQVVKCRTQGDDESGQKQARADRVSKFMSSQFLYGITEWDRDTDRLTLLVSIYGDVFRKVWYNGTRVETRLIEPGALIVNDNVATLEQMPRITEELPPMFPFEIREEERLGRWRRIDYDFNEQQEREQEPVDFLEQHTRLDLDEDGYAEPYIITVHKGTQRVVRIVADFDEEDITYAQEMDEQGQPIIGAIERRQYFVHHQFLPGIKGRLLGMGLARLLRDIVEGINTAFNQLIDAGTYQSKGGGFIGSEMRVKGGAQRMAPGQWRQVKETGGDIRQAIVPMQHPGPNQTMFAVLGMLIETSKEVSSTQSVLTGDSGLANMQPTTLAGLIEQGLQVYNAAFKRLYRSLQDEFALVAVINSETLDAKRYNQFFDAAEPLDPQADFLSMDMDIVPVADPNATTKMQQMVQAQIVSGLATQGMVDPTEATMRQLEAAGVPDVEKLVPQPDPMQQQMQQQQMQMQMQMQEMQMEAQRLQLVQMQLDLEKTQAEVSLTVAKVDGEMADAMKTMADADIAEKRVELEAIKAALQAASEEAKHDLERSRGSMARRPRYPGDS